MTDLLACLHCHFAGSCYVVKGNHCLTWATRGQCGISFRVRNREGVVLDKQAIQSLHCGVVPTESHDLQLDLVLLNL